jgi:hypothetical protein
VLINASSESDRHQTSAKTETQYFFSCECSDLASSSLTLAGTERRARGERAGTHAEARTERRRDVAKKVAATGAAAFGAKRGGGVGAEPMTACFADRIDTLHREAGQILHFLPPRNRKAQIHLKCDCRATATKRLGVPLGNQAHHRKFREKANLMAGIVPRGASGVKRKDYKMLWQRCASGKGESFRTGNQVRRFSLTIRKPSY